MFDELLPRFVALHKFVILILLPQSLVKFCQKLIFQAHHSLFPRQGERLRWLIWLLSERLGHRCRELSRFTPDAITVRLREGTSTYWAANHLHSGPLFNANESKYSTGWIREKHSF
jgi:hypothetical protein